MVAIEKILNDDYKYEPGDVVYFSDCRFLVIKTNYIFGPHNWIYVMNLEDGTLYYHYQFVDRRLLADLKFYWPFCISII